jgi:predicted ArsR family transcriptional regulator
MKAASLTPEKITDTRERIVRILRRGPSTVEELANELGITRNAVRSQINLLKGEGIVELQGSMPSGRRPAAVYGIRAGAGTSFSKAYPVVLSMLVQVLADKLSNEQFNETVQELGLRLAGLAPRSSGTLKERLRNAVSFLESLGSVVDVTEKKGKIVIKGYGCPITGAVEADGRLCIAMAAMIGKLVELPTTEKCNRDNQPACCFEIKLP